ncbi:MAG: LysM peptidoglycan-binding domain-containing protein [Clostridium sp.]|nr:LysM peptidoglycan-binding domain-containing protein [Clostridium sp.]
MTIDQISDAQLRFRSKRDKKVQQSVPTKDIYMYYIEAYGNTYVTPGGKRFSGEPQSAGKNVDIIYLVSGKEIGVETITRFPDSISYVEAKKRKKNEQAFAMNLDNSQVFMICYKNGMTELITNLEQLKDVPEEAPEEAPEEEEEAPQYSVVFHEVKKWDTLEKLSKMYGVSPQDIREWNDIPANFKVKAQLEIGSNLMIYVPLTEK